MNDSKAVLDIITRHKIVPVIALEDASQAGPLAEALVAGGLPIAEITFRTAAAEEAIRIFVERGDILTGAGTVLTCEQADIAKAAGAKFAISPGFNPDVVRHCQEIDLPIYPGVSNPTDIEMALSHGLHIVKFFPAEAYGGVKTLRAIGAPYPMMRFIPTGGISVKNLSDYLSLANVVACGGSWMVKPSLFSDGPLDAVEQEVRAATNLIKQLSEAG